jgi:hypothetical protein
VHTDHASFEVPPSLTASRLYAAGGALRLPHLLGEAVVAAREPEARAARPSGHRNVLDDPGATVAIEERGGSPGRAFTSAHGSAVQWTIFSAPALVASVEEWCGLSATPTGGGSYSYYEQAGDYLSLHRDIVQCDLTLITCLKDIRTAGDGGELLVYSNHIGASLAETRRAGRAAATPLPIGRGDTVALLGGVVAHEVSAMQPGQERIVSVMCYRVIVDGKPLS